MNKKTLKQELESGMPLDLILELTTGQCGCTIHKVLRQRLLYPRHGVK